MKKRLITLRIDVDTQMSLAFLREQAEEMTLTDVVCLCVKQVASAVKNNLDLELSLDLEGIPTFQKMERMRTIEAFKKADNWVFSEKNNFCHFCGKSGIWLCNQCHAENPGKILMVEENNKKIYGFQKEEL